MTTILSPTRGGEASYANQDGSIAIAKERKARLIFIHFTDVDFLANLSSPVLVDMEAELEHMGEFVLAMAQERARKVGVDADAMVQHGEVKECLLSAISEYDAETVILGSPHEDTGVLTEEIMRELVQVLTTEGKVEVIFLHDGQIVAQYPSAP